MHRHLLLWFYFEKAWLCSCYTAAFTDSNRLTHTYTCTNTNTAGYEILLIPSHFTCSRPCCILVQANATLQEFANLRKYSEDWIESSNYIINSAQMLGQTLPLLQVWNPRAVFCISDYSSWLVVVWKFGDKLCSGLQRVSAAESWCCALSLALSLPPCQNSLGNSFVKNFIEMQTDINVGKMKETLSNFCEWAFEGLTFVSCRYQA